MSTVVEVRETALYAPLTADAELMALLGVAEGFGGVYDGMAPQGAPYDFITIGGAEEGEGGGVFGGVGMEGLENIRIHTRPGEMERPGTAKAKAIYAHLYRILHRVTVDLGPALLWNAQVRYVTDFINPDSITTTAAVQYTYSTMRK